MNKILELTSENFYESIKSEKPILVDFFAQWCGPCKMLHPILDAVAGEVGESCIIAKCDIDQCMEIAQKFNIMNVPTLVLFKSGKEADRAIGFRQKTQILEMLKK